MTHTPTHGASHLPPRHLRAGPNPLGPRLGPWRAYPRVPWVDTAFGGVFPQIGVGPAYGNWRHGSPYLTRPHQAEFFGPAFPYNSGTNPDRYSGRV